MKTLWELMSMNAPDQENLEFLGSVLQFACLLGCANKDLWALCAPIFIIVVYCRTAPSYFLGGKE